MDDLNKIIHERARLLILTYLARNEDKGVSFTELKDELGITSGNLSVQINKLKEAEYVEIHKSFKDNRPLTSITITPQGLNSLNSYFEEMEKIINSLKE